MPLSWIDIIIKFLGLGAIAIAAVSYYNQTKTKRAEWLKTLFEKFYENAAYKDVRRWIESNEINKKINLTSNTVSDEEEKLTDYLNFFEFIAMLEADGQLRKKDVSNLFDYYLKKLKTSETCMKWINNKDYGFEKLSTLLKKIN